MTSTESRVDTPNGTIEFPILSYLRNAISIYEVLEAAKAARIAKQENPEVSPCAPHVANSTPSLSIAERMKSEIFEIEKRTDLTTEEKIAHITHITCVTCAGIAVQPIPFADIFILTPIQAYMGSRIAAIRGVPVSESEASVIIKEILGVIGLGFAAQQIALGIWKTLMPGAGEFMTIPLVYGLSFAIMRVMDACFVAKATNRKLSDLEIKSLWKQARSNGEDFTNRNEMVQVHKTEEAVAQCATIQKRDDKSYSTHNTNLTIPQIMAKIKADRLARNKVLAVASATTEKVADQRSDASILREELRQRRLDAGMRW